MKYKLIDHTADLRVLIYGNDQNELFQNSSFALFDLITDMDILSGELKEEIAISGDDVTDLMINWLRELHYLWAGKQWLVKQVHISEITENSISALISYDLFDRSGHEIKNEIKAVTYHMARVSQGSNGWEAEVIFDV